ncbi:MAG TPA: NAD-dependent epimerase/dehydratase family protein [Burkholderiales bacterium]|nr:NAD-dependent epimerase/dehydratase family protein [Burkholderiales bacterium]
MLAGATGLVGGLLLRRLLDAQAYARVIVLSRRPLQINHAKLTVEVADFERLPALPRGVDDVFCCLGTTLANAGNRQAFARVDHDHVVALGRRARNSGPRNESALGAARLLAPLLRGRLARYRAIRADAVAAAMLEVARTGQPPPGAIESDTISRLASMI